MIQPGRTYFGGTGYRYGFNGQEKTVEVSPNSTTAEFWQYDARIARTWNVDPVLKEYESPYMCFAGSPILLSDPAGDCTCGDGECPSCGRKHNTGGSGILIYEIESFFNDAWTDITCRRRWDEGLVNVNRAINPLYNGAALIAGEENLGIPAHMTPMTRTEAAFNLTTQLMWWKYAKLATLENSAQLENQMMSNAAAQAGKSSSKQTVINLTKEERQKIIAYLRQEVPKVPVKYKAGDIFDLDHTFIEGVSNLVGKANLGSYTGYTAEFEVSAILKSATNKVPGSVMRSLAGKAESVARSAGLTEVQLEFKFVVSSYIKNSEQLARELGYYFYRYTDKYGTINVQWTKTLSK